MPLAKIRRMMLMGEWKAVTTASKNSSTSTIAASGWRDAYRATFGPPPAKSFGLHSPRMT